jgi:hypothetical protein
VNPTKGAWLLDASQPCRKTCGMHLSLFNTGGYLRCVSVGETAQAQHDASPADYLNPRFLLCLFDWHVAIHWRGLNPLHFAAGLGPCNLHPINLFCLANTQHFPGIVG